jgi:hypothetical protein
MWWRMTTELKFRVFQTVLMASVVAVVYVGMEETLHKKGVENLDEYAAQHVSNVMAASILFFLIEFATEACAQDVPHLIHERPMLYRELEGNVYNVSIYYITRYLALLPILILQAGILTIIVYPVVYYKVNAFSFSHGLMFFLAFFSALACATTISQVHALFSPTTGVGNTLYTTFCTLSRLFCGFVVLPKSMNGLSKVLSMLDFMKYNFYAMGTYFASYPFNFNKLFTEDDWNINDSFGYWCYFFLCYAFFHALGIIIINLKQWSSK